MTNESGPVIGVEEETGGFLMLGKKERVLIREILSVLLGSEDANHFIEKKFGKESVQIGNSLMKKMGG